MPSFTIDTVTWATQQFSRCDLGDQRRTKRLVQLAAQAANDPASSLPQQTESWSDAKAAYRLLGNPDVTFTAITAEHHRQSRQVPAGRYLLLGDTTELDFGVERGIAGLGPTGNGGGRGFLLHSALVVSATRGEIHGLAGQTLHYRAARPRRENTTQRLKRRRESQVWGTVIDQVGPPPESVEWVHVLDRGADNFEVFVHLRAQRGQWVVRLAQLQRKMQTATGSTQRLATHLASLPVAGTYELPLRARPQQASRVAKLQVKFGQVQMPAPVHRSAYVKAAGHTSIAMTVIEVSEVATPRNRVPIRWVLSTSLPVETFRDAWQVIGYYEQRWLIEEWHKALKSGCRVAERQLKSKQGLEALTGLLSVVAVRLLQLKSAARAQPNRPARELIPARWIAMLAAARRRAATSPTLTVREFYRSLAQLGGFLARTSDGEPGWITIWRGWHKLRQLLQGAKLHAANTRRKCG